MRRRRRRRTDRSKKPGAKNQKESGAERGFLPLAITRLLRNYAYLADRLFEAFITHGDRPPMAECLQHQLPNGLLARIEDTRVRTTTGHNEAFKIPEAVKNHVGHLARAFVISARPRRMSDGLDGCAGRRRRNRTRIASRGVYLR